MTLFDINTDPFEEPDYVCVLDTHIGKGVFAVRAYPKGAVIGEIEGELNPIQSTTDDYTIDFDDELQLDPAPPFRFLNHSCDANCDFDIVEQPQTEEQPARSIMCLIAIRNIAPDEALTIDYNWPANCAIPCQCRASNCRGWVVAIEELEDVRR